MPLLLLLHFILHYACVTEGLFLLFLLIVFTNIKICMKMNMNDFSSAGLLYIC